MARTRYATDRGLIARMGATMFLIGLVFTGFIALVIFLLTAYSNVSNGGIIFIAVLLGAAMSFGSYYWSDKIALSTANAQLVSPQQAPELHGVIDRLCALADMPKPRVAIAPTDLPNAFATGRSSKVAVVCVTQGLLRRLDDNELDASLEEAVERQDEQAFETALHALLAKARELGTELPADTIEPSQLILPREGATIEEVRSLLSDGGLIPG